MGCARQRLAGACPGLLFCALPGRSWTAHPSPPPPWTTPLAQPHYRLADYLEQTGRTLRRTVLAPAALWDAFVRAADVRDLPRLAQEAARRRLERQALRLYQRAAEAGDRRALLPAADLLQAAGHIDDANSLFQRAVEAGDPDALRRMAQPLERAGRINEAIDWYQRAAEAGDHNALGKVAELAEQSEEADRIEQAVDWLQILATEAGDPRARWEAARLMARAGRFDEAIDFR
jgi:TPR repeat protein